MAASEPPAQERLRRILFSGGLASDVFLAEEAYALSEVIGRNADNINANGYGNLFGRLQAILSDFQTIAITKVFEPEVGRFQLRTVPAALDLLEDNADVLEIADRWAIEKELGSTIHHRPFESLEDAELTHKIVEHFRRDLPSPRSKDALGEALNVLKTTRDKRIAHSEDIDRASWSRATWGDARKLTEYTKRFLGVVGMGYLGIVFMDDNDHYVLDFDAQRTAAGMRNLLREAGLTDGLRRFEPQDNSSEGSSE